MKNNQVLKSIIFQNDLNIAIIGLGYVGLPLGFAFADKYKVIGYDLSLERIEQLKNKVDINDDIDENLFENENIKFTSLEQDLEKANIFIVGATPVDKYNKPDFKFLNDATQLVSNTLKKILLLFMNLQFILERPKRFVCQFCYKKLN